MDDEVAERLSDRTLDAHRVEPCGWRGARRSLTLADLVAVEQQHAAPASRELARYGKPSKLAPQTTTSCSPRRGSRAAPRLVLRVGIEGKDVRSGFASAKLQRRACDRLTDRYRRRGRRHRTHGRRRYRQRAAWERSDDLLIEVDGQLVPNYAATIKPINEHDVVSGEVVRIDKDEVLVDIGYKSEGVIPATELSIRRSVDPADEVSLGDRVDALVLTKEDAEGRLILSKKRARFEKAWRRIEAAAGSGEPVEGTVIEVVKGA